MPILDDEEQLISRALRAHHRTPGALYPSQGACTIEYLEHPEYGQLGYVVLRNTSDTLAVYRILHEKGQTKLRALRNWPREFESDYDPAEAEDDIEAEDDDEVGPDRG